MKKKLVAVALLIAGSAALSSSKLFAADDYDCLYSGLLSSITLGPPGTTTSIIGCANAADIDRTVVEREAVMVVEENKVYQPSYLGAYAKAKGYTDIREAARDIVDNGVEE